jgi:predicted RNA-binding Zn-ribbon protein involved in translation (DUF1610 family)
MADAKDQIRDWFDDGELGVCPQCGEQGILPLEERATAGTVCVSCGLLLPPHDGSASPPG